MFSKLAPTRDVLQWFAISVLIALIMIVGVVIAGSLLPGSVNNGGHSLLLGPYSQTSGVSDLDNFLTICSRNLLVLLLHFCCCLIGAIIGRPHSPLPEKWARFNSLHKELPKWMADMALAYAFTATLASVAIQTTGLGFVLADISAYSGLSPLELGLLLLPHAPLELTAVFLPLAVFLIQAKRKQLHPLNIYSWQSLLLALPLIMIAALIEITVTPMLVTDAINANGGLPEDSIYAPWEALSPVFGR